MTAKRNLESRATRVTAAFRGHPRGRSHPGGRPGGRRGGGSRVRRPAVPGEFSGLCRYRQLPWWLEYRGTAGRPEVGPGPGL